MDTLRRWFEVARQGAHAHLQPMEGLRGFAVFLVFLVHSLEPMRVGDGPLRRVLDQVQNMGNAGVDLFFVLSGFLIYGSLIQRKQPFVPFMRRRLRRIYPAFTVVFLLYVALSLLLPAESKLPTGALPATLYLVENYLLLPGIFPIRPMITVAWSLSFEMFFYLVVPLLLTVFRMRERTSRARTWFLLALGVLVLAAALLGGHSRLLVFVAGMLLFERLQVHDREPPPAWLALSLLLGGLLSMALMPSGPAGEALQALILSVTFYVLCVSSLARSGTALSRAFTWTPLRWLGNVSYSYYLIHVLGIKVVMTVLAKLWPAWQVGPLGVLAVATLTFLATLVPSALLFLLVERPFSMQPDKQRAPLPKLAVSET